MRSSTQTCFKYFDDPDIDFLSFIIRKEELLQKWFSEQADRFWPYDATIGKILEEIAMKRNENRERLSKFYGEHFGLRIIPTDVQLSSDYNLSAQEVYDHFFVVNKKMAHHLLREALAFLFEMHLVYKQAMIQTENSFLLSLYENIFCFEFKPYHLLWDVVAEHQEQDEQGGTIQPVTNWVPHSHPAVFYQAEA